MSNIEIEFVPLTEFEIKEELGLQNEIDEKYYEDYDIIEETPNYFEAKCGDIFVNSSGKYIYVCEFCDDRYNDIKSFGEHLECKHFNDDFNKAVIQNTNHTLDIEAEEESDSENAKQIDKQYVTDSDNVSEEDRSTTGTSSPLEKEFNSVNDDVHSMEPVEIPHEDAGKSKEGPIYDEKRLYCVSCKHQFSHRSAFSRHKARHRSRLIFPYDDSPPEEKKKPIRDAADTSTDVVDEATPNYCSMCNRHFNVVAALKRHAEYEHGNVIPASLKNDPTYLKCKYCHKEFEQFLPRREHEVNDHIEEKPFRCVLCPKQFKSVTQRSEHENTHNGIRPYQCSLCPKSFSSRNGRNNHIQLYHSNDKKHPCELCGLAFKWSSQLELHMRGHLGQKNVQCDQCGQRFRKTSQLTQHLKRHANRRDYPCDICGKTFFTGHAAKEHKVLHTDVRRYKCNECGKTFQLSNNLRQHRKVHSIEKQYECMICHKKFAQNGGLYSHMKSHGVTRTDSSTVSE